MIYSPIGDKAGAVMAAKVLLRDALVNDTIDDGDDAEHARAAVVALLLDIHDKLEGLCKPQILVESKR